MKTHKTLTTTLFIAFVLFSSATLALAKRRHAPAGGRPAVVVDERLSALRATPNLDGKLLQRISRGRLLAITARKVNGDGIVFYRVKVTRRTEGWIQKEAVVAPTITADDEVLLRLVQQSREFDRLARARIFLDTFRNSRFRPEVLLLLAESAEAAAAKLSRDAARRLEQEGTAPGSAPEFSYFLNYNGLDRYNRQGVRFIFVRSGRQFHYNGAAWWELVKRYPKCAAAAEARKRLEALSLFSQQ